MEQVRRSGARAIASRLLTILASVCGVLLVWQIAVLVLSIPAYIVPPPGSVLQSFATHGQMLWPQTMFTLAGAGLGLLVSISFATATAVAFAMHRGLAQASLPVLIAFRSMPAAAIAPIIMLFFGRGLNTSIVVVAVVTFFPLLVNLARGLAAVDRNSVELLHVYGASRWQQLRLMRVPFALPFLFTGLRISGSSAILGAMLSEWITGSHGLGNLILESGELRETALLWAAVLVSVVIALIVFWITSAGERLVVHWRQ
jgi:ABC-type nitrate/sulfonate/bicarbonate transport system permease component